MLVNIPYMDGMAYKVFKDKETCRYDIIIYICIYIYMNFDGTSRAVKMAEIQDVVCRSARERDVNVYTCPF